MLSRRETLTTAVIAASGTALLAPLERWLGVQPGRLPASAKGAERIGMADVAVIERATRYFATTDADIGGAFSREAAVGQLRYAVDLARHASYSDAVGNRLLAAIAELSGLVGWLCHDSRMPGPAHRYLVYGLQAARESTDPRAPMLVVSILADMAQHMRWRRRFSTALRLHDLAASQLPTDRRRFNILRAVLATRRVEDGLCYLGPSALSEVKSTCGLAFDLYAQASADERADATSLGHRAVDMSEAALHGRAAYAYLVLARDEPRLARDAEERALYRLANLADGQGRIKVMAQTNLASIRFVAGEPEQASNDAEHALNLAGNTASAMVKARLRDLLADAEPYVELPRVRDLMAGIGAAVTGEHDHQS